MTGMREQNGFISFFVGGLIHRGFPGYIIYIQGFIYERYEDSETISSKLSNTRDKISTKLEKWPSSMYMYIHRRH